MPAVSVMVITRYATVRPRSSIGLSGRTSLTSSATIAGVQIAQAMIIAVSRAIIATRCERSGNVRVTAS